MKKRLLSLFVVLTMLLAAVCVPVSASTGMLPAKEYKDAVTAFTSSSDIGVSNNVLSVSDGVFVYNSPSGTVQSRFNAFTLNTEADAENWGTLSFKIKADASNTSDSAITFILGGTSGNAPSQIHPFKMTTTGYMGMGATEAYSQTATDGITYTKDVWYTVGIIFNKNNTFDYYIDGVKQRNVEFSSGKAWDGTAPSVHLFANTTKGKFYVDELMWSTGGFFAEPVKTTYSKGATVNVKFSEPLTAFDDSKIKLYECETGAEVTGIAAATADNILGVTLPSSGMNAGKEYRIELDGIKGATGCTLATDSVYFNCENEGEERTEVIGSEDFDDFTETNNKGADTDYYQPNGWFLGHRWSDQYDGFVRPVSGDANYATSMQIGQLYVANKSETHAYLPFAKKADTGIVKITYEMKPQRLIEAGTSYTGQLSPNLQVMVYPDGIDSNDQAWATGASKSIGVYGKDSTYAYPYGRMIAGISAKNISFSSTTSTMTTAKTLSADTTDANAVSASDAKWYKVEMVLDFDKGTVKYYLDTEEKGSTTLTALDVDAVAGISFGTQYHATDASILIDNVKVEHTYVSTIKTDIIKEEDFDDFATTGTIPSSDTDYKQPVGWYLGHKWNTQVSPIVTPVSGDAAYNTSMRVGNNGSDGGSAHAYLPLGKDMNTGVVTITYDMKPERASTMWNDSWEDVRTPNLVVMVYPDGIDDSDTAWAQGNSTSIGNKDAGRYVAGIFSNHIGALNSLEPSNSSDQRTSLKELTLDITDTKKVVDTDSIWYRVKIELNFDEGTTTYWLDETKTEGVPLATLNIDGIQGISFGTPSNARDASTLIDNVSVTHTYNNDSAAGVMQVRFSDYDGNNYGSATTHTTVLDTIAVSFWSKKIDAASLTTSTVKLVNAATEVAIPYTPSAFDAENGVYTMNLSEYLTKGTTYKLVVDGVTADGSAIDKYEQTIISDSTGRVIVEPMYIMHGATKAESGALQSGDTVTAGTRVINTTGETQTYSFFMALYDGGVLKMVDFREIAQDGSSSAANKDANISCSYTLSADEAANITNIKAFLWDGFDTLGPVLPAIEFTNTSAAE